MKSKCVRFLTEPCLRLQARKLILLPRMRSSIPIPFGPSSIISVQLILSLGSTSPTDLDISSAQCHTAPALIYSKSPCSRGKLSSFWLQTSFFRLLGGRLILSLQIINIHPPTNIIIQFRFNIKTTYFHPNFLPEISTRKSKAARRLSRRAAPISLLSLSCRCCGNILRLLFAVLFQQLAQRPHRNIHMLALQNKRRQKPQHCSLHAI